MSEDFGSVTMTWRRIYIDLPIATDEKLARLAKSRGMSKKSLVASLVNAACGEESVAPAVETKSKRRK